jgi:hypothetical protein
MRTPKGDQRARQESIYEPEREPSLGTRSAGTLILYFRDSKTMSKKMSIVQVPSMSYFVMSASRKDSYLKLVKLGKREMTERIIRNS